MTSSILTREHLRAARALLLWSQAELAKHAGVGVSTVADFERSSRTPTPATMQALATALESAGIKFTATGIVLPPIAAPNHLQIEDRTPLSLVTASDLAEWARRSHGPSELPELIYRLIIASVGYRARLRFPSGSGVNHRGWDGICVVDEGTDHVPEGLSVWELSCQHSGIERKAESDYQKRTRNPAGVHPESTTYVFVTPHEWSGGEAWAERKRLEGPWRDVRILEGVSLTHWLDTHPGTAAWLAERIGKPARDLVRLEEFWAEWSATTTTPISTELVLADRENEATKLLQWLREPPAVLAVQSESTDEAIAFLYASLNRLPQPYRGYLLSRCLIVASAEASRKVGVSGLPLVVVVREPEPGIAARLAANGQHVFGAFSSTIVPYPATLRLPRPWTSSLDEGLREMGLGHREARLLASSAGRSLTILRRSMPAAPNRRPSWADAPPSLALQAMVMFGAWDTGSPDDRLLMEEFTGSTSDNVCSELRLLSTAPDAPVRCSGSVWRVASRRDSWLLLGEYFTDSIIHKFLDRAIGVISGGPYHHSRHLRHGVSEFLALLSNHHRHTVLSHAASGLVAHLIQKLLSQPGHDLWRSLSEHFQTIAEASPTEFLAALDRDLATEEPTVMAIFEQSSPYGGDRHLAELVWSLEILAWSPDYFGRVCAILCQLSGLDNRGGEANHPIRSLLQILSLWHPQTNVTWSDRQALLGRLIGKWPDVAWKLLVALIPRPGQTLTPSVEARWCRFEERRETVTWTLIASGVRWIGEQLLANVGSSVSRWSDLMNLFPYLDKDWQQMFIQRLGAIAGSISETEQETLRAKLRHFLHIHCEHVDASWSMDTDQITHIKAVYDAIEPSSVVTACAWLFSNQADLLIPWRDDLSEHQADLAKQRHDAILSIVDTAGQQSPIELMKISEWPSLVGSTVMQSMPRDEAEALLAVVLQSDDDKLLLAAGGMIAVGYRECGEAWALRWWTRANEEGWGNASVVRIVCSLPAERWNWELVAKSGVEAEQMYWAAVSIYAIDAHGPDLEYAVAKLLEWLHPRRAVSLLGKSLPGSPASLATVLTTLQAAATTSSEDDGNERTMFAYYVDRLFTWMDAQGSITTRSVAELELKYFDVLSDRPSKRVLALYRLMAVDPLFFASVIRAAFRPDNGEVPDDPDQWSDALRDHAIELLFRWELPPSADDEGRIDSANLVTWVAKARAKCAELSRGDIGDHQIGQALAACSHGDDGVWPDLAVREILEEVWAEEIRRGFVIGTYNRRGATFRGPLDGGSLERDLASRYLESANEVRRRWPRTAEVLRRIAASYESDARRFDEWTEQREPH